MNVRRLQGWALVGGAAINLIGLAGFFLDLGGPTSRIVFLVGGALYIFGVPAILSFQPMGTAGVVGMLLLELAAVIAFLFNLLNLAGAPGLDNPLFLTISAFAGMLGALIIGWLTTRGKVFPVWVGWALILQGVLNFAGGIYDFGALTPVFVTVGTLASVAALLGYGFGILRHAGQ